MQNVIVGHSGTKLKVTVLKVIPLAAVLGIELEQPVILNDAVFFQHLADACHRGALFDGDGFFLTQLATAVHFAVKLHDFPSPESNQGQNDHQNQQSKGEPAAGTVLLVLLILLAGFFVLIHKLLLCGLFLAGTADFPGLVCR